MTSTLPLLLLDGATGTELTRRGVDTRGPAWSAPAIVRAPGVLAAIHEEYARAGADVITANTFRTQRRSLSRIGDARRAREWTIEAVRIAREAVERAAQDRAAEHPEWGPVRVAGSVSPLEDSDNPELAPDETTARIEHGEHVGYLAEAGVDLLLVETMGTIAEARAATTAATATGLETWSSIITDASGQHLLSGEPLEAWIEAMAPLHPAALLVNCVTPEAARVALAAIVPLAHDVGALPGAYANLGSAEPLPGGGFDIAEDPEAYAEAAKGLLDAGARILGGCCGTTPEHTRAVRAALDERLAAEGVAVAQGDSAWRDLVARAAAMAGGGRAVVVAADGGGPRLAGDVGDLLGRYEVLRPAAGELAHVPVASIRLAVVDRVPTTGPPSDVLRRVSDALEPGGWLAARIGLDGGGLTPEDLRVGELEIREVARDGESTTFLARRLA